LLSRLWLPKGIGPWPTLLMRQPYGRAIASTVVYAHPSWYASHGYAVLVQDVRGRGDSDGDFSGFAQEAQDGADTLTWLRQQPWCNGRIGTYGFSYQGLSQLLCADPAALPDALAPAMTGLDERQHWATEGGCHWWALGLAWGLQLAAQGCRRRSDDAAWKEIRHSLESGAFLQSGLELLRRHDPEGMVLGWLESDPADSQGWRIHAPPAALWQRPMLLIGGWHDPHLRGVLDLWQRADQAGTGAVLRIGAWSHLRWNGGLDRLQLAFFDQHLRDGVSSAPGGDLPLLEDLVTGAWLPRSPHQSSGQCWGLRSEGLAAVDPAEGTLVAEAAAAQGNVVIVHDPWRPLPGRGGHLGLDAGPARRDDLDARTDVACFTSPALSEVTELLGEPQLTLTAAADQPGFDLCVALSRLTPDGAVHQISTGMARFRGEGCQRAERRHVRLQPLLASLHAGDRLRLSIGLAAWPQVTVNPGNGTLPLDAPSAGHRVITVGLALTDSRLCMLPMVRAN
jgi:putative CocE/NonD family hydrolase